MEDKIRKIEKDLDLNNNFLVNCVCKQYDTIKFIFNMYSDGVKVDLSDCIFRLQAKKGDGLPYVQNDIKYIKVSENTVTIDCDNQLTARAGDTVAEVVITDKEGHMKTSFDIRLSIKPSAIDGLVDSEATITILDTLEEKLNRIDDIGTVLEEANNIQEKLANDITTATPIDESLSSLVPTGATLKGNLEQLTTNGTVLNKELDTANEKAEKNIEALNSLGDVTNLAQQVETNKSAIAEHTTQLNTLANDKVDKTKIINDCNTTEEGFVADARQLKYLKDYIDKLQEGTINKPYTHEEEVIGQNLLINGWHIAKTKVGAPFEDSSHDYFVFVIKTDYFVRQIWYDLWDSNGNNTYTRQCNINNNWLWTSWSKLENN